MLNKLENIFVTLGVVTLLVHWTALVIVSEMLYNVSLGFGVVFTVLGLMMIVVAWCSKENTYK